MANISRVYQKLMEYTNWGLDAKKAIESWNSSDRWGADSVTNYKNWATSILNEAGNGLSLLSAAESFGIDVARFTDNQDPNKSFDLSINMAQSFGGLIEAIGQAMQVGPAKLLGIEIELAGITITYYANTLDAAHTIGSNLDIYGAWQSVTQTDAKAEAMIYAAGLAKSLDHSVTTATINGYIDASKNNDFGIGESVEYIKNIRKLLGLGTDITASTANDVYTAVQDTRLAIQTLFGDSKFQISDVSNARNDLPAFLSLYYLVPFSIKPTDAEPVGRTRLRYAV